jgi:hypothetical protein
LKLTGVFTTKKSVVEKKLAKHDIAAEKRREKKKGMGSDAHRNRRGVRRYEQRRGEVRGDKRCTKDAS